MNFASLEGSEMNLLDCPNVSAHLGVPEGTLAQWRHRGIGPRYIKVGKHVRYDERDVLAWLEANRRGGEPRVA